MNKIVRSAGLFLVGLVIGAGAVSLNGQAPAVAVPPAFEAVNHVGIAVDNFDEAMKFYTGILGLRQAFVLRDDAGAPALAYLQLSQDTFIEIQPATPQRPIGLTHVGVAVSSMPAAVQALRARGLTVTEPAVGRSGAPVANVTVTPGVRFELVELRPESMQRRAMDNWKPVR